MHIYGVNIQPYGLLNVYARVPFKINDDTFLSVAEYIYISMYNKDLSVENRGIFWRDQKKAINGILGDFTKDFQDLQRYMIEGMKIKLQNHDMSKFKGSVFSYIAYPEVEKYLNNKVEDSKLRSLNQIISGVRRALRNGEEISDQSGIPYLANKYVSNMFVTVSSSDPALKYVNSLVPFLKFELENEEAIKRYNNSVENLKEALWQVLTEKAARSKYTTLNEAQIRDKVRKYENSITIADKQQQMDQYYADHKNGLLKDELVTGLNFYVGEDPISRFNPPPPQTIILTDNNELSPVYNTTIVIGRTSYNSPYHYAISKMLENMGHKGPVSGTPKELANIYVRYRNDVYLTNRLIYFANMGTVNKVRQNTVLGHLLKTGKGPIIYEGGQDDLMLGVNLGKFREALGKLLEGLRNEEYADSPNQGLYSNIFDNVYLKDWIMSRTWDIVGAMSLFKTPSNLQQLYGFPDSATYTLSDGNLEIMKRELNADEVAIKTALNLIGSQIDALVKLSDKEMTQDVVDSQNQYLVSQTGSQDLALKYLDRFYVDNSQNLHVDKATFIARVLAGRYATTAKSRADIIKVAIWPRVNYWAHLQRKIDSMSS